ncbi:hypothetical protein [Haladaptatus sp. T7]|uniref:hypothetical protein n=1 Tax=Haladaptatus sp. T7 TaxID=2029368 RepID=UPI0021A25904|nr:hypothetical protein [Haladaptatus sp. T7]GKZ14548.1 hypothetical protein HAL_24290 [Haladaptatus sp. T7]
MYSIEDLRTALSEPEIFGRELNRIYHHKRAGNDINPNGIDIMAQDWDNLILLDACRYDIFRDLNPFSGELRAVESRGSATVEFLKGNFRNQEFTDTVYASANPQYYKHREEINCSFHAEIEVWNQHDWHPEWGTILPETMNKDVLETVEQYPNKRLIAHYLQPHRPFIGETAKSHPLLGVEFNRLGTPETDSETYLNAYQETLSWTFKELSDMLNELPGKTVITSDHGHLISERGSPIPISGQFHWRGNHVDKLLTVPWLELPVEERRDIFDGDSYKRDSPKEDVSDRLKDLGYM